MAMLYRHQVEFGVGHGVSIHADCPEGLRPGVPADDRGRSHLRSRPNHAAHRGRLAQLAGLVVDMKELGETPTGRLEAKLRPLLTAYAAWIEDREADLRQPDMAPPEAGPGGPDACREALRRIEAGLSSCWKTSRRPRRSGSPTWRCGSSASTRSLALRKRRDEQVDERAIDVPANRSWYPFQLAFILLNLPGITKLDHTDRSEAPEPWPTCSGSPRAAARRRLPGLSAYTMGLRRLQGTVAGRSGEHGVAVLMRYTLRLLTIQQFQRATALICACEVIRRERRDEVGQGAVPHRPLGRPEDDAEHDRPGRRGDPAGAWRASTRGEAAARRPS